MGKDKRTELRQCARCRTWLDDEGEFCAKCEDERLAALNVPMFPSTWDLKWAEYVRRQVSGTYTVEYDDPLDQARADSMEGGE